MLVLVLFWCGHGHIEHQARSLEGVRVRARRRLIMRRRLRLIYL